MVKPGYKQTEVGVIPEDWNLMPSGEFIEVLTDFTANGSFASLAENVTYLDYPDYARLVRLTDIRTNFKNQGIYVSKDSYDFLAKSSLFGGELLLANVGAYAGYSFLFQKNFQEYATLGPNMFLIKANKNILHEEYVPLVFGYGSVFKQLIDAAASSAQPKINKDNVRKSVAIIPPLDEQEHIVEVLSDVDGMVSSLDKLIAKKKAIKQGAMQELLTGKKRLPGFTGKWRTINLGEISKIKTGDKNNEQKSEDGQYPFFVRSQQVERINSYSFAGEAILIPGEGNIGQIFHYINGKFDWHQRVYKISDFPEFICGKYVYYQMKFTFGEHALKNTVKATVDSLRLPTFESFGVLIPPTVEEQISIAAILSDLDTEIGALEQKLAKARQIKQGMMQQLLTGKIRLV